MDMKRILRFAGYFLKSRHRRGHGIHSPFVFDLVNRILRSNIPGGVKKIISDRRKEMSLRNDKIIVDDLGAGSGFTSSVERRISDISRRSSIRSRYGRILFNLASLYNGKNILELGTAVGISTQYIAMGAPESRVISIEGSENLAKIAGENLMRSGLKNVDIVTGSFAEQLEKVLKMHIPSMIFIDGNHRKGPVLEYFNKLKELIDPDSVIILDDINYSEEMAEAWNEIKSDPQVSVSIDIFQMGFVFFREGIVKQEFIIKY